MGTYLNAALTFRDARLRSRDIPLNRVQSKGLRPRCLLTVPPASRPATGIPALLALESRDVRSLLRIFCRERPDTRCPRRALCLELCDALALLPHDPLCVSDRGT
jgi:hypothetical protein